MGLPLVAWDKKRAQGHTLIDGQALLLQLVLHSLSLEGLLWSGGLCIAELGEGRRAWLWLHGSGAKGRL